MEMLIDGQWVAAGDGKVLNVRQSRDRESRSIPSPLPRASDVERALRAAAQGSRRMRALPGARAFRCPDSRRGGNPRPQGGARYPPGTRKRQAHPTDKGRGGSDVPDIPGFRRGRAQDLRQDLSHGRRARQREAFCHDRPPAAGRRRCDRSVQLSRGAVRAQGRSRPGRPGNAVIAKPPSACPLTLLQIAGHPGRRRSSPRSSPDGDGAGGAGRRAAGPQPDGAACFDHGEHGGGDPDGTIGAETLKKIHLELGGNDATIVCADADLEKPRRPWYWVAWPGATDRSAAQ